MPIKAHIVAVSNPEESLGGRLNTPWFWFDSTRNDICHKKWRVYATKNFQREAKFQSVHVVVAN